jgi:hypothetical protein
MEGTPTGVGPPMHGMGMGSDGPPLDSATTSGPSMGFRLGF